MNWRAFIVLFFVFSYLTVSLLQIVASIDGILYFFGLHWFFALLAALVLVFIPAIGPLAGVYGAVMVWNWPLWSALLLFFWIYIFYGILILLGFSASFWTLGSLKKEFARKPETIEAEYTVKKDE